MGWWATDNEDDVIGDEVADIVVSALTLDNEIEGVQASVQELLDALAMTLQLYRGQFLEDPDRYEDERLEAVFRPPAPTLVSSAELMNLARDSSARATRLCSSLSVMFVKIARHYRESELGRKPRFTEVLEAVAFPLRVRPERLLRDATGLRLQEFRVRQVSPP